MDAPRFAVTKIEPPLQWTARVPRPALHARIRQVLLTHREVLRQAAGCFGKTSAWAARLALQAKGEARAWAAMDPDDDAERLFGCLVAALEGFDLPWRTAPAALVEVAGSHNAGLRRSATELLYALAGAEATRGIIVLGDPHRARSTTTFALPDALMERLPPHRTLLLASRTMPPPAADARDDHGLSAREREVLDRIAAGHSNKAVARVLDISPHTLKRHVANILDRLGLTSRGQAAAWLRDHA